MLINTQYVPIKLIIKSNFGLEPRGHSVGYMYVLHKIEAYDRSVSNYTRALDLFIVLPGTYDAIEK
jgi:hypothetical protein